MPLHALRRFVARHPLAWVLGLALLLVGAQTAHHVHVLSHLVDASASSEGSTRLHLASGVDCTTCLAGAALAGAAPAAVPTLSLAAAAPARHQPAASTPCVARFTRIYASRAPPLLA